MHCKYDITLKDIIKDIPVAFLKILTGFAGGKFLDVKLSDVQMRELDLLIELPDGTILHIEIQTYNDSTMLLRMYLYSAFIYKVCGKIPRQIVLYVGDEPLKMKNVLKSDEISYSYKLVDIKEINCQELLSSSKPEDNILALLCKTNDVDSTFMAIVDKLSVLPQREREDYIRKLVILSGLRKVSGKIKEGVERMPITIDIEKDLFFIKGVQKGLLEGKQEGLLEGVQKGLLEGVQKGLLEGKQEGLLEGKQEGLLEGLIEGIELALEIKYGSGGLEIMDMVRKIDTRQKLELFKELIRKSTTLEELKDFFQG